MHNETERSVNGMIIVCRLNVTEMVAVIVCVLNLNDQQRGASQNNALGEKYLHRIRPTGRCYCI
jgi:hypothetical protein